MSHFLTDEQKVMRDSVRQFVEEEVKPAAVEIDAQHTFPEDLWKRCAELEITGIMAPTELGGLGESATTEFMVMEEIGRGCPTLGLVLDVNYFTIGTFMGASDEQKQKWIPAIARGEGIGTGHIEQKIGLNGSDTGTMTFDRVFVPDENLLVPTAPSPAGNLAFLDVSAICLGAAEEARVVSSMGCERRKEQVWIFRVK